MSYRFAKPRDLNVGCEVGADRVRLAQLDGARLERVRMAEASIDPPADSGEDAVGAWIARVAATTARLHVEGSFSGRGVVVGAPPALVSYRRMTVPQLPEDEIERTLCGQLARECNVQQSELCCDYYEADMECESSGQRREVVAVCAPARPLECIESQLAARDLELRAIDTPVGAVARCLSNAPAIGVPEQPLLVVRVGASATLLCVVVGGVPVFVHSFGCGRQMFESDQDSSHIAPFVVEVTREMRICMHFLEERGEIVPSRACILGAGSAEAELREAITEGLSLGVSDVTDLLAPHLRTAGRQLLAGVEHHDWLVPLGLCAYGISRGREEGR